MNTPNQAAWFERYVTDWTGPYGRLGRIRFRMKDSVFPGDRMVFTGSVKNVDDGRDRLRLGRARPDADLGRTRHHRVHGARRGSGRAPATTPGSGAATTGSRAPRCPRRRSTWIWTSAKSSTLLRDMVRGLLRRALRRSTSCAAWRTTRRATRTRSGSSIGELGLSGSGFPRSTAARRRRCSRPRSSTRSSAARSRRRPHFASCVLCAGVLLAAGSDEQQAGLAAEASRPARRSSRLRGSSPSAASAPARRAARGARRGRRLPAQRHEAPRPVRARGRPARSCSRAPATAGVGPLPRRPERRRASRSRSSASLGSDTQYHVDLAGVRVPAPARIGARIRLEDLGARCMHDGDRAARRAGDRRRRARARDHRRTTRRTASSSTSRSAPSRRSRTTWPTRRPRIDGGRTLVYEAAWAHDQGRSIAQLAPMAKLFACETYRETTRDVQAGLGRRRLHDRVRHPALLPARQAAPALVVGLAHLEELIAAQVLD